MNDGRPYRPEPTTAEVEDALRKAGYTQVEGGAWNGPRPGPARARCTRVYFHPPRDDSPKERGGVPRACMGDKVNGKCARCGAVD